MLIKDTMLIVFNNLFLLNYVMTAHVIMESSGESDNQRDEVPMVYGGCN